MLDLRIAQAIFRVRQIERATNDPGPWTISYGPQVMPAVRWVGQDRVIFRAHFPDTCWLTVPDKVINLMCRGEVVGVTGIDPPDDGEFIVEWCFALPEPVRV